MRLDPSSLDEAWRLSFEQAWRSWCSGTIPIGAAVTDAGGAVVSTGRNRVFNADAPPGQVAGSWLAHAEVNALLQLPPESSRDGYTVTSTAEPCLLCAGALIMSLRGRIVVRYASADPLAGGMAVAPLSPQGRRRDLAPQRLEHTAFLAFADALHLAESIRRAPDGVVAAHYRTERPHLYACAAELEPVLRPYVFTDVRLDDVLGQVEEVLRSHPVADGG